MTESSAVKTSSPRLRVIFAACIGSALEWYDFFLYGTAAALVFGELFFPKNDPIVGTMLAFLTFGVGFVVRPLGGILFGVLGDRYGRKPVLVATLLMIGIGTTLIGMCVQEQLATPGRAELAQPRRDPLGEFGSGGPGGMGGGQPPMIGEVTGGVPPGGGQYSGRIRTAAAHSSTTSDIVPGPPGQPGASRCRCSWSSRNVSSRRRDPCAFHLATARASACRRGRNQRRASARSTWTRSRYRRVSAARRRRLPAEQPAHDRCSPRPPPERPHPPTR